MHLKGTARYLLQKVKGRVRVEEKEKRFKQRVIKGVSIFLIVILVFTILSKTIYTFLLPQVDIVAVTSGRIETKILKTGRIGRDPNLLRLQKVGVKATTRGQVTKCLVEEGQKVSLGQPLFEIKKEEIGAALKNSKLTEQELKAQKKIKELELAQLIEDQAKDKERLEEKKQELVEASESFNEVQLGKQIEQMKEQIAVSEPLYKEGLLSERDYKDKKEALSLLEKQKEELIRKTSQQAKATIRDMERAIDQNENRSMTLREEIALLENKIALNTADEEGYTLKSPIEGEVYDLNVGLGGLVVEGEELASIIPTTIPITISFELTDKELSYIQMGQGISVEVNQQKEEAIISKKSYNQETGSTIISCELPEGLKGVLGELEPKMYREANLQIIHLSDQYPLLVPNSSLMEESGRKYIFFLEEREGAFDKLYKVSKREVNLLKEGDYMSAVSGALLVKDNIVRQTSKPLREGMEVAIRDKR